MRPGTLEEGLLERALADEIGLLLRHQAVEPDIAGRDRAVGLVADDDIAFLGAQHMQRLGAIGLDAELGAGGEDCIPQAAAEIGGRRHFVGELARKADAIDAHRIVRRACLPSSTYAGSASCGNVEIGRELREHFARLGAGDGELRPLLGDRRHEDLVVRPFGLQPFFEPGRDAIGAARRRVHEEVIIARAAR